MNVHPLFRQILYAFFFTQVCFFSNLAIARSPDPLTLPQGEIRAVLSADTVNQELVNQGRATITTLPFTPGSTVYEIRTTQDLYMVRTYLRDPSRLKEGAVGGWLMSSTTLRGLSPIQVRDIYALPALNDYITTVKVPAGTILRTGSAGPIAGWGDGGGQQILLVDRIAVDYYQTQRTLVDQNILFSSLTQSGNPGAAAAYLDRLPQAAPFSDWSVVNLMLGYLTAGPLQQALTQIGPERYDTLTQLDIQNSVLFTNALMERRQNRMTTVNPQDNNETPSSAQADPFKKGTSSSFEINQDGFNYWGQGLGAFGRQDGSRDQVGFQYQTGSFLTGVDYWFRKNCLLGTGLSLSRTGFSWNDNLGDGNVTQINLGLYGSFLVQPFFIDGALTGGIRKADVARRISFPGVDRLTSAFPDGYNGAVHFSGGLSHQIGLWNLQPMARMDLIYVAQDALSESGAESLNLKVDQYNTWTWRGELGLRLARTFVYQNQLKITPDLWLGWGYQAPLDNRELKASLNGQPGNFTVNGYNNSTGSFLPKLGIMAQGWGKTSFYLRYEGDFRSDYTGHSLNAGMRVPF
jgi:outer membrane autotransporter protein